MEEGGCLYRFDVTAIGWREVRVMGARAKRSSSRAIGLFARPEGCGGSAGRAGGRDGSRSVGEELLAICWGRVIWTEAGGGFEQRNPVGNRVVEVKGGAVVSLR